MANDFYRVPLLVAHYDEYLAQQDSARFMRNVSKSYTLSTLERLAQSNDRMTRRAAVLALSVMGDYDANHVLGRALTDRDRGVRSLAENGIRSVWERAGNVYQRAQLQIIIRLVSSKNYSESIRRATELIEQAPWFAEVWNQRAIAHFAISAYEDSVRDCRQALEINPYHFAAAAGMGQCHMRMNNPLAALECFRRALRLNPNMEAVRAQVVQLQRTLRDR
ncbi:MAG: tetratricopeptide repeat protein [Planctomycetes bacterium]|nr:tetratricopeptide repeat protein [Planctomycetota bacterium]